MIPAGPLPKGETPAFTASDFADCVDCGGDGGHQPAGSWPWMPCPTCRPHDALNVSLDLCLNPIAFSRPVRC